MKLIFSSMLFLGLAFVFGTTTAAAQHKKIGMKRAMAIATEKTPGLRLKSKELEKEKGKWQYSFEFKESHGDITEVNVDAYTGEVLAVEHETKKQNEKEAREEKNEKKEKH
jgi:Peptidase propeptide and YPEB domain